MVCPVQLAAILKAGYAAASRFAAGGPGAAETWIRLFAVFVAVAGLLVSCVGVLMRLAIFRRTIVASAGFFVFILPWLLPFSVLKQAMEQAAPLLSRASGICGTTLSASLPAVAWVAFVGLCALMLTFFTALIVYFSQPAVKAWFAQ
jgi:hypothetical protein